MFANTPRISSALLDVSLGSARKDWRGLLGKHVGTSRQLLRKLLDRERFVFYPMAEGQVRWYDIGVTPTLDGNGKSADRVVTTEGALSSR